MPGDGSSARGRRIESRRADSSDGSREGPPMSQPVRRLRQTRGCRRPSRRRRFTLSCATLAGSARRPGRCTPQCRPPGRRPVRSRTPAIPNWLLPPHLPTCCADRRLIRIKNDCAARHEPKAAFVPVAVNRQHLDFLARALRHVEPTGLLRGGGPRLYLLCLRVHRRNEGACPQHHRGDAGRDDSHVLHDDSVSCPAAFSALRKPGLSRGRHEGSRETTGLAARGCRRRRPFRDDEPGHLTGARRWRTPG